EALLQYVKSSLEIEGMALSRIHRAAKDTIFEVSITGPSSIMRSRVIPNLLPFKKKFPLMRFRFDLSDAHNGVEKLKTGLADFAILEHHQVTREMDSKILKPERYHLYGPTAWKKRSLNEIFTSETLLDYNESDMMTFNYLEKYKSKNKIKKERHYANNIDAIAFLVVGEIGFSVLSEELARPFLKKNELCELASGQYFDHKLALAWYPRSEKPEYFAALIKAIS
ncbi:MAG: LysR family transcriptional regulator, partial [Bdellovibrionaceae bacterium]|nr:LysR family transcriptional regulator [Bdellovibrio sp.]